MKKTVTIAICIVLAAVLMLSLTACDINNPFRKTEKAFARAIEASDSLDDPKESDLSSANVQTDFALQEQSGIALLSAGVAETGILDNASKVQQVLDYLNYIKGRQDELNGYKSSGKVEVATFKAGVKSFRDLDLSLSDEEKDTINAYVTEINALTEAIKGTIGKVYATLRDARGLYRIATIDTALEKLEGVVAQMDIRVDSAKRLGEIAVEINALLGAKINPETVE